MQKHDKRTQVYRRFNFGRRASDNKSTLTPLPVAEFNPKDEATIIIKLMPSSSDYFESLKAQLQRDGYVVVEKEALAISKEVV